MTYPAQVTPAHPRGCTPAALVGLRGCVLTAALALGLTSCSVLYNPDDLRGDSPGQPTIDGGGDIPDLAPGVEVGVTGISPGVAIPEGTGAVWPQVITLTGIGFKPNIAVRLIAQGAAAGSVIDGLLADVTVSADGDMLAFPLTVPVLPDLDENELATVLLEVQQDGAEVPNGYALQIVGLDELVASVDFPDGTGQTATFNGREYSSILIDQDVRFLGSQPAQLRAVASVSIHAAISADGNEPDGVGAGEPGPGGCFGGVVDIGNPGAGVGGCDGNGGQPPTDGLGAGGGGGGHQGNGGAGNDNGGGGGGRGGAVSGNRFLIPLADEGGGGGGAGLINEDNDQAGGGGGGGILEIVSEGLFEIDVNGGLSAEGGQGGVGRCVGIQTDLGSGGGGAGGAISVRAYGGVDDLAVGSRVSVRGGSGGGFAPDGSCDRRGGNGAVGRLRFDSPEADPPPFISNVQLVRGPAFVVTDPIVSADMVTLAVVAEPSTNLTVVRDRDTGDELSINFAVNSDGDGSVMVPLEVGDNEICAFIAGEIELDGQEPQQCVNITYLPQL